MPRASPFDFSTLILAGLALAFGLVAYRKEGLPWIGARTGRSMLWFVRPSLAFPVSPGRLAKLRCDE